MLLETVADLAEYLRVHALSPEKLAVQVGMSNMTIRRLLEKPGATALPSRYRLALDVHANGLPAVGVPNVEPCHAFDSLLAELETAGRKPQDLATLGADAEKTLVRGDLLGLRKSVQMLSVAATQKRLPVRYRALAVGALLYLVNPLDLVPDAMLGVGFLDDVGVLSMIAGLVAGLSLVARPSKKDAA